MSPTGMRTEKRGTEKPLMMLRMGPQTVKTGMLGIAAGESLYNWMHHWIHSLRWLCFPCSPKPTLDEVRSWGQSFDKLMCCPAGRNSFRQFLRTEFSEENMLFWLACDEFRKETNKSVVEEKARVIYEDYISILSPKEVWPELLLCLFSWFELLHTWLLLIFKVLPEVYYHIHYSDIECMY